MAELYQQIGNLKLENNFLSNLSGLNSAGRKNKKVIAIGQPEVSLERRCQLLGVPRASYCHRGNSVGRTIKCLEPKARNEQMAAKIPGLSIPSVRADHCSSDPGVGD
ncbi:hypothetical protein [Geomonas oryzae]|uniref:hypothetical protein n=1 Tax=Geomonas oryzae TaxID=2364273 RepID=UPI00100B06A3|nr:hypothetical protein [Geomonas oryzae]